MGYLEYNSDQSVFHYSESKKIPQIGWHYIGECSKAECDVFTDNTEGFGMDTESVKKEFALFISLYRAGVVLYSKE